MFEGLQTIMPIPKSIRNFYYSMKSLRFQLPSIWWSCLIVIAVAAGCTAEPSPRPTTAGLTPPAGPVSPTPYPTYTLYPTFAPPVALTQTRTQPPGSVTILGIPTTIEVQVIRIIDGDTIEVQSAGGDQDTVRLLGVDTPEINQANKPGEYIGVTDTICLDRWGVAAKQFAVENLQDRTVTLYLDVEAEDGLTFDDIFTFGRLLAFVEVEDQDISAELVRRGLARVYTEGQSSREEEFLRLQQRA